MTLETFRDAVPGLASRPHANLILLLGWFFHVHRSKATFTGADLKTTYNQLHLVTPSSFGGYLQNLVDQKRLIKTPSKGGTGYRLESKIRAEFDARYGQAPVTVEVTAALAKLADTLPDMAERAYYKEALTCYNHGAFRATVVMVWNVAFSHLCDHILTKRLKDFNDRWLTAHPGTHKNKVKTIVVMDDFNDHLKEFEILTLARDANIITKNVFNIMDAGLKKRNAAAHPNNVIIGKTQTDAFIEDLITNVVLQIT